MPQIDTRVRSAPLRAAAAAATAAAALSAELAALETLSHDELRVQWRNRFGKMAPTRLSRNLLLRLLAYRIQAEVFGDLDRDAVRLLDRLAAAGGAPSRASRSGSSLLRPGTLLTHEWQRRLHKVMVLDRGFAWNGRMWSSLSAVALAITGTKWNGHRFFGLREREGKTAPGRPAASRSRRSKGQPTRSAAQAAPKPAEAGR